MTTLVTYSSITGNTQKVAESIYEGIEGDKLIIPIRDIDKLDSIGLHELGKTVDLQDFDRIVIGYWVDKGHMDALAKKFAKSLSGRHIATFGTLGAAPDSDHGKKVLGKVADLCSKDNDYLGGYLVRGKVDPKLVEKMGKFPLKLVHPLTPERQARIDAAKPHPTEEDLLNAREFFANLLNPMKD